VSDYFFKKIIEILSFLNQIDPKSNPNPDRTIHAFAKVLKLLDRPLRSYQKKALIMEVGNGLKKYDLSQVFKFNPDLLQQCCQIMGKQSILGSTPFSSLIKCYQENPLPDSPSLLAIVIKCVVENCPIFPENDFLCFYEQSKICKVKFPNHLFNEIKVRAHAYFKCFDKPQEIKQETKPSVPQAPTSTKKDNCIIS
jgi:hypothetical protein